MPDTSRSPRLALASTFAPAAPLAATLGVVRGVVLRAIPPALLAAILGGASGVAAQDGPARSGGPDDPRIGLEAGWLDAGEASWNMELLASEPRPDGFYDPEALGDLNYANTDLAFQGDLAFLGSFHGFQIFDISNPTAPRLRVAVVCPGGQGDLSIYGDLLFMSVEQTRGRIDCGTRASGDPVDPERFRGVRIFDISDVERPTQVAAVQTCRGSHTHSLLDPRGDSDHVYVYVSGTSSVRPEEELAGCSGLGPEEDPGTSLFRIEVIRVPLDAPQEAAIVSEPRIFADPETGEIAGLWPGGAHGEGTQESRATDRCHDITTYPEFGQAAGACSGNGILLDISDPVNPVRIDEVLDPNFAYWHSATFNNDGTTVLFTDEWGGGTGARCRETDPPEWGANAIFEITDQGMRLASYYKLPVPQTAEENCVAHNGSLVPVPGRDIKVQAWYQGGVSVFDFTDPENPFEIAYFDRGPLDAEELTTGGYWSTYWYNGHIYGSEIARGFDVFRLEPSEHLSQNELDAARLVRFERFNPQHQPRLEWPPAFEVARAYLDQLVRAEAIDGERARSVARHLDEAERAGDGERAPALDRLQGSATRLEADAGSSTDPNRVRLLAEALGELAESLR